MTDGDSIQEGQVLEGPLFSEPARVETATAAWTPELAGAQSGPFRRIPTITPPASSVADDDGSVWLGLRACTLGSLQERLRGLPGRVRNVMPTMLALQRYRASIAERMVG